MMHFINMQADLDLHYTHIQIMTRTPFSNLKIKQVTMLCLQLAFCKIDFGHLTAQKHSFPAKDLSIMLAQ